MKIVAAPDSFKGSLTSLEACMAIKSGILSASPDAEVNLCPVADGGEGTVQAIVNATDGQFRHTVVEGPLGDPVTAKWGVIHGDTAVIEMASAAGITLVEKERLDPFRASTYGVGELINDAIDEGFRNFIIGIGGSATNDGGTGMLTALGYEFTGNDCKPVPGGAIGLGGIESYSDAHLNPHIKDCKFTIMCDVDNPLCGPEGCSRVFGPQKGATEEQIKMMDEWLHRFALLTGGDPDAPGAGAAGGMGYAFRTFTNAVLRRGIDVVAEVTGLESKIASADLVITGEGKIDAQTVMGKAPAGVAAIAKKYNRKVIAFCGCAGEGADICYKYGIDVICPITPECVTLEEAMEKTAAYRNLEAAACRTLSQHMTRYG